MTNLLDLAVQAHGGFEHWRRTHALDLRLSISGALYELKGFPEGLTASAHVEPHRAAVSILPYLIANATGHFTPQRVWIEDVDGRIVDERASPRTSFARHVVHTPWDQLHRLYFTGYALWNCLAAPFLIAGSGFASREIEPHRENGDVWRRLLVSFPSDVPTHSAEQIFYFCRSGVLRRMDYEIDVTGTAVAHYCYDHATVSGLVFPASQRVVRRAGVGLTSGSSAALLQMRLSSFIVE